MVATRVKAKTVWDVARGTDLVVIPTSIGWRADGRAVFGLGIQRQAARRWPRLPVWYGDECRARCGQVPLMFWTPPDRKWCAALALLPVHPLDKAVPHLSWLHKASPSMISAGLACLHDATQTCPDDMHVWLPMLGCLPSDKYKLNPDEVLALFAEADLDWHRFVLVDAEDA